MKNINSHIGLFLGLFLGISLQVNAQNPVLINDTIQPFGFGDHTLISGIEIDSCIYASLLFGSSYPHQYSGVVKLSLDGKVMDKKLFIDSSYFTGMYFFNTITHDEKRILICTQYQDTSKHVFGQIIAFNKQLDTLWTRRYGHPDTTAAQQPGAYIFSELTAIKTVPGNGFIAIGNYDEDCIQGVPSTTKTQIIKLDNAGNTEWLRTYPNYYLSYDIEVLDDGGYLFLGHHLNPDVDKLVKIDSTGQVLWDMVVDTLYSRRYLVAISKYDSNSIIIGAFFFLDPNDPYSVRGLTLTKLNLLTKNTLWTKSYSLFYGINNLTLNIDFGVDVLPDGKILVSGTAWANSDSIMYGAGSYKGFLLKTDVNGDSLWAKSYLYGTAWDHCQIDDLILTSDGGYMALGFHQNSGWILKTDANGYVGFEKEVALNKPHSNLELYPNPAKDILYVKCDKIPENAQLSILDQNGRTLIQNHWPKGKNRLELNISNLPIGLYLLEIIGYNGESVTEKFVKIEG